MLSVKMLLCFIGGFCLAVWCVGNGNEGEVFRGGCGIVMLGCGAFGLFGACLHRCQSTWGLGVCFQGWWILFQCSRDVLCHLIALVCYLVGPGEEWRLKSVVFLRKRWEAAGAVSLSFIDWRKAVRLLLTWRDGMRQRRGMRTLGKGHVHA